MMADAARYNVDQGAQIIDINMGCPAKKVCRLEAGSALMKDQKKVAKIISAVVNAVDIPVTLKTRTGWSQQHKNAAEIAVIAQDCGIQALTIHGRTREQKYFGSAEYDTIQLIKQRLSIPLIANGDIDDAKKAKMVMDFTGADAIMIGRAAQKKPWIFKQIHSFLATGIEDKEPNLITRKNWLLTHLNNLYDFYGEYQGLRIARTHINWQLGKEPDFSHYKTGLMQAEKIDDQLGLIKLYFENLLSQHFDKAG